MGKLAVLSLHLNLKILSPTFCIAFCMSIAEFQITTFLLLFINTLFHFLACCSIALVF